MTSNPRREDKTLGVFVSDPNEVGFMVEKEFAQSPPDEFSKSNSLSPLVNSEDIEKDKGRKETRDIEEISVESSTDGKDVGVPSVQSREVFNYKKGFFWLIQMICVRSFARIFAKRWLTSSSSFILINSFLIGPVLGFLLQGLHFLSVYIQTRGKVCPPHKRQVPLHVMLLLSLYASVASLAAALSTPHLTVPMLNAATQTSIVPLMAIQYFMGIHRYSYLQIVGACIVIYSLLVMVVPNFEHCDYSYGSLTGWLPWLFLLVASGIPFAVRQIKGEELQRSKGGAPVYSLAVDLASGYSSSIWNHVHGSNSCHPPPYNTCASSRRRYSHRRIPK